ncbi:MULTISPECIES: Ig-like domain-containing protein [Muribaculaceae]|uniref:Ig-like domain-containing protein n=1 Tax=Muribaculaceae TaxID=2005473 RepID=UPI0025830D69|nr:MULTISPECIES: Ig-like domain-containing protein [Muribaculaceae]
MKLSKKIRLWLAAAMAIPAGVSAQEQILAFPGAEGFGKYTLGARAVANPEVYHVTNLNDSGAGSLRDAVSQSGRIVVFDVCGTINLKSTLIFKGNNTILGQTAPGEGIQVYGNRVSFSGASNLIVRHMRFRMGTNGDSGKDAAGIANGHDMIFDHLSVLWGRDENFSINPDSKGDIYNITIQNSIIGQGLQSHSCGGLLQTDGGVTIYRNLYIENKTRNPKVKGLNQYVNNVVYNWGNGGCYIMGETESASWAHIENNYFMRGPWKSAAAPFIRGTEAFHIYAAGNYYDDNIDGVLNGKLMPIDDCRGWMRNRPVIINGQETTVDWGSTPVESLDALNKTVIHEVIHGTTDGKMDYDIIKSENYRSITRPIPVIDNMMTAEEAYKWIIDNVGPVLPARDEVDKYIIDELTSYGIIGTENGISAEAQLPHKGTGVLSGGVKPLDTDGDGIPDEWEIKNGLNPNDASDAVAIAANGYTNIENFANGITEAFPYIKKPVKFALTGDPNKTSGSFTWDTNGNETEVASIAVGNRKRIYKFTYNYMEAEPVKFKFNANGKKLDVNDILVERWLPEDPDKPIEVTAGSLDNTNLSYADGSLSLTFNQEVAYNGGAEIKGITQWENISPVASGKKLTISYEALNVNTDYSITFPEGSLTDLTGNKSYIGTVKISTTDFGPAKQSGETHYGKQAKTLPLTFAPFNAVAPFETIGGIMQTSQNDYPHWVQVSGRKSADHASMTSTSDKIMTLFDGESKLLALDIEYIGTGSPRLKLQESRNCDVTPGWRTMRVLEKGDFPFKGEIAITPRPVW